MSNERCTECWKKTDNVVSRFDDNIFDGTTFVGIMCDNCWNRVKKNNKQATIGLFVPFVIFSLIIFILMTVISIYW